MIEKIPFSSWQTHFIQILEEMESQLDNEWRDKMTKQRHSIRFTPISQFRRQSCLWMSSLQTCCLGDFSRISHRHTSSWFACGWLWWRCTAWCCHNRSMMHGPCTVLYCTVWRCTAWCCHDRSMMHDRCDTAGVSMETSSLRSHDTDPGMCLAWLLIQSSCQGNTPSTFWWEHN